MRKSDAASGREFASVLLDASSTLLPALESGNFEAASAWIHHLDSPSSALVSSLHS